MPFAELKNLIAAFKDFSLSKLPGIFADLTTVAKWLQSVVGEWVSNPNQPAFAFSSGDPIHDLECLCDQQLAENNGPIGFTLPPWVVPVVIQLLKDLFDKIKK